MSLQDTCGIRVPSLFRHFHPPPPPPPPQKKASMGIPLKESIKGGEGVEELGDVHVGQEPEVEISTYLLKSDKVRLWIESTSQRYHVMFPQFHLDQTVPYSVFLPNFPDFLAGWKAANGSFCSLESSLIIWCDNNAQ